MSESLTCANAEALSGTGPRQSEYPLESAPNCYTMRIFPYIGAGSPVSRNLHAPAQRSAAIGRLVASGELIQAMARRRMKPNVRSSATPPDRRWRARRVARRCSRSVTRLSLDRYGAFIERLCGMVDTYLNENPRFYRLIQRGKDIVMHATLEAIHRASRQPGIEVDDTESASAIEEAADELSMGAGAEETESKRDEPTDEEIDEAIIALEERAEEISRGDNADIQLEVDPDQVK